MMTNILSLNSVKIFRKNSTRYIPRCSGNKKCPLLSLSWYLFSVVSDNRSKYLLNGSNGNALCTTTNNNVFSGKYVIPVLTIPFWNS